MFLPQFVESVIGGFEAWPTWIIRLLFVEDPTRSNVRKMAAFFYGNGLPVHIAVHFYILCNGKHPITITHHMYAAFFNWMMSDRTTHLELYYNVRLGRLLWINGWRLDNREPVFEDRGPAIPLGTEGTGLDDLITYKIGAMIHEPFQHYTDVLAPTLQYITFTLNIL
jgi:hypothetical protein